MYSAVVAVIGAMLMRGGQPEGFNQGAASPIAESTLEVTEEATTTSELPAGMRMGLPLADVPVGYGVVVVALESIENGSVIDLDTIVLYALPERFVPDNAPAHIEQVEGRIARTNIHCGQIITSGMLATNAREVTPNMGQLARHFAQAIGV